MKQQSILIVDDDADIVQFIEVQLKQEGFKVLRAYNGEEALYILDTNDIQLVILDIMMPGMDGVEVCRKTREKYNIPVIFLSAKSSDIDKVIGLSTGADVITPASGMVVSINNDEPDLKPRTDDFDSMTGNHIYLRLDETGTYLILAHLKKGSVRVKEGQHVTEGEILAQVGNSGSSSEPHLHIHHQRQNPFNTSMFLSEGLPLYFQDIDGPAMPKGGVRMENGNEVPVGDVISPL
ncbi:response regulator [Bacillus pseudomycoides]|uniref:response regulator n=1 Tax=Bacillus pseudomycoides TaxID=64104 RepID=UPI000BEBE281|nr:response regulator [Bacillus pseudomycoides]PED06913.1 hypothetical protein COO19_18425 [Bacillus pseudomycoides]PEI94926.1 hypothetical protein CN686_15135 [Bacillus pseudomycoides]PEK26030.1 hypothetical protein CN693_10400 [Bacillus pseudomycoides]PEM73367.1 hypothetical protein CN619_14225 [Bacillus pseudomycoides]PEO12156.1 hypothetical protein CN542_20410 [Bacillus pseudomycoides]